MKRIAVCGAGGFIGHHLVRRLKADGHFVRAIDLKKPEFEPSVADEFQKIDLRQSAEDIMWCFHQIDEVYQLAADMGGAGFVFTGDNDADILRNSALINLNVLESCRLRNVKKVFFASSACVYQSISAEMTFPIRPYSMQRACAEESAYPANPDSDYGFEKLFAERLYSAYRRNHDIECRIGRFHNIHGAYGTWRGGREKAPAALCRKIAELPPPGGEIEIWGTGMQNRSFLHIDEAIEGVVRLMTSDYAKPVNIGSSENVTIGELVQLIAHIAGKDVRHKSIHGPVGVDGRNSDNTLIEQVLGWKPTAPLVDGLRQTYAWIKGEVDKARAIA